VSYDCVVVGTGLAGLTAATRIAESGRRVLVVAKGVGSLYLGGATIDVLGYLNGPVASPRAGVESIRDAQREHPYSRVTLDQLDGSIQWFKERVGGFVGDLSANMLIPTALGVPKPSAVAPESIAAGDVRTEGTIALVGFNALKDFYPRLAAANLERAVRGITARSVDIDVSPDNEPDVSPIRYARALDDVEFRKQVISAVEGRLDGCDRVGFPAVIGVRDARTAWLEIQDSLGVSVFEIPSLPPSVPGIRLFDRLTSLLRAAGGRLILNNTVVSTRVSGRTLTDVVVDTGARRVSIPTRTLVLATGGVAAGGIAMDSSWAVLEPALGLPVAGVPARSGPRFDPDYFADHPLSGAGVATDSRLRPVDEYGEVVYENVFVAGATLAGGRPWHEKSGNGISLATGWAAAEEVVGELG
jgi:glycerol-3-phosphate dehydrogenase subunit B